jgi:hypothetical protein
MNYVRLNKGERRMDRDAILKLIGEEISRLERVRELLSAKNGYIHSVGRGAKAAGAPKKRILSQDARNRIAQAQKRRWAKQRRETLLAKKVS